MKSPLFNCLITLTISCAILLHTGQCETPISLSLFLTLELISKELQLKRRLRWCRRPETRFWVQTEHSQNCKVMCNTYALSSELIMIIQGYSGTLIFCVVTIIFIMLLVYAHKLTEPSMDKGSGVYFVPLDSKSAHGIQFKLPMWTFLPRSIKQKLLEEQHRKTPVERETHLFINTDLFHTTIRVIAPNTRQIDPRAIPEHIWDILGKYPQKAAVSIVELSPPYIMER